MTGDPTIADIQHAVCAHFGLPLIEMRSDRRSRRVARPRQIAMYLARELTTKSLTQIAGQFGKQDHSTVIHGIKVVSQLIDNGGDLATDVAAIRARLLSPNHVPQVVVIDAKGDRLTILGPSDALSFGPGKAVA